MTHRVGLKREPKWNKYFDFYQQLFAQTRLFESILSLFLIGGLNSPCNTTFIFTSLDQDDFDLIKNTLLGKMAFTSGTSRANRTWPLASKNWGKRLCISILSHTIATWVILLRCAFSVAWEANFFRTLRTDRHLRKATHPRCLACHSCIFVSSRLMWSAVLPSGMLEKSSKNNISKYPLSSF